MLRQIQQDAAHLSQLISSLTSETRVVREGMKLQGEQLETALVRERAVIRVELNRLNVMLDSGVTPDMYTSIVTNQTFYPSKDELRIKQSQLLPPGKHTFFCIKEKKKPDGLKNSHMKLVRDNGKPVINFFMEHRPNGDYPKGSLAAKVKQGNLQEGNGRPKYAVKIYHKNMFHGNTVHEFRLAMRSAYCCKLLGREGYAFRHNDKQYLAAEWIAGVPLDVANQKQIQSMPIPRRIVMAISLLRELNILHKSGLIYNDIKPGNVMADYGRLCFVRLVSVRPKDEMLLFGNYPMFTQLYLPNAQMSFDAIYHPEVMYSKFNEATDLHALGITLAHLFPEIYIPRQKKVTSHVNGGPIKTFNFSTFFLYPGREFSKHPGIQKIIDNMFYQENEKSNSCEIYIKQLQYILNKKNYPDYEQYLAEDRLAKLDKNTPVNTGAGKEAFKGIEIELLEYNQRLASVSKLRF